MKTSRLIFMLIILISLFPDVKSSFLDSVSSAQSLDDFIPEKATYDYDMISNIDCSPDNKYVAFGCVIDNSIVLWDKKKETESFGYNGVQNSGEIYILGREPYIYPGLKFSPDSKYLLVYSSYYIPELIKSHLTLYDVENKTIVREHDVDNNDIEDVAFSPDGKYYASSYKTEEDSGQCIVNLWDTRTGDVANSIISDNYGVKSLTFTPDGEFIVISFEGNNGSADSIVFFDADTGTIHKTLDGISAFDLQFSNDGSILAGEMGMKKDFWYGIPVPMM